ncbi:OLC1v1003003C1 [Oldenlandia corymbosa var. corymbosa]|uniref:OLC1v1003003C1 n=1 Tax=Oldenlandia corymbosa var. corymbosa TaxID=529605 RepID=A0AAV1D921_OLDCO|nr:OLC1v1003003C1 [Oldenlandia corymbosa var. corymbosa]
MKSLEARLQKVKKERIQLFTEMENLNRQIKMGESSFLEAQAPCMSKRSEMECIQQRDDKQGPKPNPNEAEPVSVAGEDQMSICASKGKPNDHPSSCFEDMREGPLNVVPRRIRSKQPKKKFWKVRNKLDVSPSVKKRAEEIEAKLHPEYPKFAKILQRSHVSKEYILNLPRDFCEEHMPRQVAKFILKDQDGIPYETEFHPASVGYLRAGWKNFAIYHHLVEGDAIIFQLIKTRTFKVYIVKSTEFVDFQDFNIFVNGSELDFKLPDTRFKYYELCKAQKSYLHAGFLQTIDPATAVHIISNAVGIADAIRSATVFTAESIFADWDQTLTGFEILGLDVGFLRDRVSKLAGLAKQAEDSPPAKRLKQVTVEWNQKGEEMETASVERNLIREEIKTLEAKLKTFEAKLLQVEQERAELFVEKEALNEEIKKDESRFLEEAQAPCTLFIPETSRKRSEMMKENLQYYNLQHQEDEVESFSDIDEDQMLAHLSACRRKPIDHPLPSSSERTSKKFGRVCNRWTVSSSIIERANLDPRYPSFAKLLLPSHVTNTYTLIFPKGFCKSYMPAHDVECSLQDEHGKLYQTIFQPGSTCVIRVGWRDFAINHGLRAGDAVAFQLTGKYKFKVYIVRSTSLGVHGSTKLSLLEKNNDGMHCGGGAAQEKGSRGYEKSTSKQLELSKAKGATKYESSTAFVNFPDSNMLINGGMLDLKLPDTRRPKYYELCKDQRSYLHSGFHKPAHPESAVASTSNAVDIAEAIRCSNISTVKANFAYWDEALKGLESRGLEVGFLRARLTKLVGLAERAEDSPRAKRLKQATVEWSLKGEECNMIQEEMKTLEAKLKSLEAKLQKVKQERVKLFHEIETSNVQIKMDESRFLEEAKAPW